MTQPDPRYTLWDEFLKVWPISRLETMTLDEYTNTNKTDSFCYWLEARTEKLGSIWGMNAFKFGVYARSNTEPKANQQGRVYTPTHAWHTRYGNTRDEAFELVRSYIITIARAAERGDFAAIDNIPITFMVRWKIAFLYQPRDNCRVVNVLNKWWLGQAYKNVLRLGPTAGSVMHGALSEKYRNLDVFERGDVLLLLLKEEKLEPKFWVLPIDSMYLDLVQHETQVAASAVAESVHKQLRSKKVAVKDHIALSLGGQILARGEISEVDDEEISWTQTPTRFSPRLLSVAGYELKEITDPDERIAIWEEGPKEIEQSIDAEVVTEVVTEQQKPYTGPSHNILLYGPPGTGKTFRTISEAITLCGEKLPEKESDQQELFQKLQGEERISFVTFHQSYGYEEFVEGLRPQVHDGTVNYSVEAGVFKKLCMRACEPGRRHLAHVLVIDEVNRGNISRILGELITLIEADKRVGAAHALEVTLPYSKEKFGVPQNLHILGTLNTADRSIALLDVALRRRFRFVEMMPDSSIIQKILDQRAVDTNVVQLTVKLLDTLNRRIAYLYDREHQLGHAFFLGIGLGEKGEPAPERAVQQLRLVLVESIFPLLQEYFYGEWTKTCLVLGCPTDEKGKLRRTLPEGARPLVKATVVEAIKLLGVAPDDDEKHKLVYSFDADFVAGTDSDDAVLALLGGVVGAAP